MSMNIPVTLDPRTLGITSFLDDQVDLSKVKRGVFTVLHGPPGVGKTTTLCHAPNVRLIPDPYDSGAVIAGLSGTIPNTVSISRPPEQWTHLLFALDELSGRDHGFQNVILDNGTGFQTLLFDHVRTKLKMSDDDFWSYTKGPKVAAHRFFPELMTRISNVLNKGINVWFICHTKVGLRPSPANKESQAYIPCLEKDVWNTMKASAELVLFLHYDLTKARDGGIADKTRASGGRTLYTRDMGWAEAKSWLEIPDQIMMGSSPQESWPKIEAALQSVGRMAQPELPVLAPTPTKGPRPAKIGG